MLRVAHVTGGTLSGSTRVVMNLLRHHDRARFAPSVCFFSIAESDPAARAEVDAIGVPRAEVVKASRYDWRALGRLTSALRSLAPDLVVLHGFGSYSFGAPAARLARVRALVRVEHSPELYSPLYRLVSAMTAPWVDSTILVSRYLCDYLDGEGVRVPHPEVIYNGIELAPFENISRVPFSDGKIPIVLMTARLDVAKDHATLIDAFAILQKRGVRARLQLAGDGPLRAELAERAARAGVAVEFLGYRADLPSLYESCDVGVLATRYEGFGLAVAEAMAAARPVVATRVAAIPELFDDGVHGFFAAPNSPESLADALARLLADPARAVAMGQAGRARARVQFALAPSVRAFDEHLWRTALRKGLAHERGGASEPLFKERAH